MSKWSTEAGQQVEEMKHWRGTTSGGNETLKRDKKWRKLNTEAGQTSGGNEALKRDKHVEEMKRWSGTTNGGN